jgi:hypothetical protein
LEAIAITAITIVTLLFAPANNKVNSGSTYNRAPDGCGARYAFMSKRGTEVQRWQKPFKDLAKNRDAKPPSTLLRIYSKLIPEVVSDTEEKWVEQGNTLVNLGVRAPVTPAPFSTLHPASAGEIKIDAGRRYPSDKKQVLDDRLGAISTFSTVNLRWTRSASATISASLSVTHYLILFILTRFFCKSL